MTSFTAIPSPLQDAAMNQGNGYKITMSKSDLLLTKGILEQSF